MAGITVPSRRFSSQSRRDCVPEPRWGSARAPIGSIEPTGGKRGASQSNPTRFHEEPKIQSVKIPGDFAAGSPRMYGHLPRIFRNHRIVVAPNIRVVTVPGVKTASSRGNSTCMFRTRAPPNGWDYCPISQVFIPIPKGLRPRTPLGFSACPYRLHRTHRRKTRSKSIKSHPISRRAKNPKREDPWRLCSGIAADVWPSSPHLPQPQDCGCSEHPWGDRPGCENRIQPGEFGMHVSHEGSSQWLIHPHVGGNGRGPPGSGVLARDRANAPRLCLSLRACPS
jgi:hypothetical protein